MEGAHGVYLIDKENTEQGKKKGGKAFTKREPVTEALWQSHLEGKETLGVIPIREDNTCLWGAIDIDEYDLDLESLAIRSYKKGFPFFPCRSKSGGCHLLVFLKEPMPAGDLQKKLREIAAYLGHGDTEIFPKQSEVLLSKGDLGNWLNMPYFGEDKTTRYCLDYKGTRMRLTIFLAEAERKKISPKDLMKIVTIADESVLEDGPPCLQCLLEQGFPKGTRNSGLFSLGVYCRKAFPDTWAAELDKMNTKSMNPPLPAKEVQSVTKQLDKKDYAYKCNDQPIVKFCNPAECRTRRFGIGGGSMPSMRNLRKIPTDQPVWLLDVNDKVLELSTDDLQLQVKFQKMCMNVLNIMPPKISDKQWQSTIQALLDKCIPLDKPPDAGIIEQFAELVHIFCTDNRMHANSREEILLGRPYIMTHPSNPEEGERVFFRLRDLEDFFVRNNFRHYTKTQIISKLTGYFKAEKAFLKIRGGGTNLWSLPTFKESDEPFELPELSVEVL